MKYETLISIACLNFSPVNAAAVVDASNVNSFYFAIL